MTAFLDLPDDILIEIWRFLDGGSFLALHQTNRELRHFVNRCRPLWLGQLENLSHQLPLPFPPFRKLTSLTIEELQSIWQRAYRLDATWQGPRPNPNRSRMRHLLTTSEDEKVVMFRVLPGARWLLVVTSTRSSARMTCWDAWDGSCVAEWTNPGRYIESLDVDWNDDEPNIFMVAISVHFDRPDGPNVATDYMHVFRLSVPDMNSEATSCHARFDVIASVGSDHGFSTVSIQGDYAAAYSCSSDIHVDAPFAVCILDWKRNLSGIVIVPEDQDDFVFWPTIQVLPPLIVLYEERNEEPTISILEIPETIPPNNKSRPVPIPMHLFYSTMGKGHILAYQTRFSKQRHIFPARKNVHTILTVHKDPLDVETSGRTITYHSLSIDPRSQPAPGMKLPRHPFSLPVVSLARDSQGVPDSFSLGRYGRRPVWMEEEGGKRRLVALVLTNAIGEPLAENPKKSFLDIPPEVDLDRCRFLDFDDAEGMLSVIVDEDEGRGSGVWLLDFNHI